MGEGCCGKVMRCDGTDAAEAPPPSEVYLEPTEWGDEMPISRAAEPKPTVGEVVRFAVYRLHAIVTVDATNVEVARTTVPVVGPIDGGVL